MELITYEDAGVIIQDDSSDESDDSDVVVLGDYSDCE